MTEEARDLLEDVEQAWQTEITQRLSDTQSGKVERIPWLSVKREAQKILGKQN